jgi:hypothetical protein
MTRKENASQLEPMVAEVVTPQVWRWHRGGGGGGAATNTTNPTIFQISSLCEEIKYGVTRTSGI